MIKGSISSSGTKYLIDLSLHFSGTFTAAAQLEEQFSVLERIYKSIPEALIYGMDIDPHTLTNLSSKTRPTSSVEAFGLYAEARRLATADEIGRAMDLLDLAISRDRRFAMAYWGKGELYRLASNEEEEKKWKAKAEQLNPDHPRLPVHEQVANPLPAVVAAAINADWLDLSNGLRIRTVTAGEYGIEILAWEFDPARYALEIHSQREERGSSAAEIRRYSDAVLVVNGGFFDIDANYRLSPSGMLIIGGQQLRQRSDAGGSGVLYVQDGAIKIGWSRDSQLVAGATSAVQAGPMVVDPGGKNGIYQNDSNRLDRTAICLNQNGFLVILVKGGISLFELGHLLSSPTSQGGFNCERALNLDGGPSSQASFAIEGHAREVEGVWKAQNFVAITRR